MSRILRLILLIGVLLQVSLLFAQGVILDSLCEGSIYVKTEEYEGVIFSANCPENWKDNKTYRWSPTEEDIVLAERLIKKYILNEKYITLANKLLIKKYNRKRVQGIDSVSQSQTPVVDLNLDKYYRQYMGFKDKRGRETLYVKCFWKEKECEFPYWKRNSITICDGGSYYWNITVDLKRKKCFAYSVHQ
ncbi:MAG: hypothetical protein J5606_07475 [Bacteroidales bacterium]|nr:hypothetical protein [Bacteroidales bacterium]